MTSAVAWGLVAAIAVLWPSRVVGPIDGAPLDTLAEVLLLAIVLPLAGILYPRVFSERWPRVLAGALFVWKMATWLLLTQQGLCATFAMETAAPNHFVLRRSWDFRTPMVDSLPQCSAVLTRSLQGRAAFPAWFLNLPVGTDWNLDKYITRQVERPETPRVMLYLDGYSASSGGVRPLQQTIELTGENWRFDMPGDHGWWRDEAFTITPPSALDLRSRSFWFVSPLLALALVTSSMWSAVARLRLGARMWIPLGVLAAAGAALGLAGEPYVRALGLVLLPVLALRFPWRLRNTRAVVLFVGVPLLAMLAVFGAPRVGHFTIYTAGDDWQTFQRFAARIFFQGYWLEGGEPTFWQQPLYRWIVGFLHVVFGDSSAGELYWDAFGLLAMTMLAYALVKTHTSHRWALAAAVGTLATTVAGPNWYLIGRGLSEFTAVLWLSLAVFALLRARLGHASAAIRAGAFGTLAAYTRLNHLILVVALVVLLLPRLGIGAWLAPRLLAVRPRARAVMLYGGVLAFGLGLFAWRTWFYTGHFSLLYGTTRQFNSTGLSLDTVTDLTVWRRVLDSVLMVITVSDPPRLDPRSLLVVAGVAAALLGVLRAPVLRDVAFAPAVLTLAAVSSAFIARGLAYPGRFSLHLIPLAVSVSVLVAARLMREHRA